MSKIGTVISTSLLSILSISSLSVTAHAADANKTAKSNKNHEVKNVHGLRIGEQGSSTMGLRTPVAPEPPPRRVIKPRPVPKTVSPSNFRFDAKKD